MDNIDKKILKILLSNAKESNVSIAKQLKMVPSAIFQRIKKLESQGYIQGYELKVNREALELPLTTFLLIKSKPTHLQSLERAFSIHPHVLELHCLSGSYSFLAKIVCKDLLSLQSLIESEFSTFLGIDSIENAVVLKTISEHQILPL